MHIDEREDLEEPLDGGQVLASHGLVETLRDDDLDLAFGVVQSPDRVFEARNAGKDVQQVPGLRRRGQLGGRQFQQT